MPHSVPLRVASGIAPRPVPALCRILCLALAGSHHAARLAMVSYAATTDAVEVSVRPVYLDAKSDALVRRFVFAYFVRIENHGAEPVRLLRRRWAITDAEGVVEEVEGPGVVGQQPTIEPGEAHAYHSFCVLQTFQGSMTGTYLMERPDGERFRARIPRFHLQAMAN